MEARLLPSSSCKIIIPFLLATFTFTLLLPFSAASVHDRKVYIVYMGDKREGDLSASSLHMDMLQQVLTCSDDASTHLLYSYTKSFNGFAANLTEEEKQKIRQMDGVVSVFPSEKKHLHTTRSWDFMGFYRQKVQRSSYESDIIIGVIDTGVWPESESFSDDGLGPPPSKWKGICQSINFTCNNKIVGARFYNSMGDFSPDNLQSPRDSEGHGTHTASTAAGDLVRTSGLKGLYAGTARGGVPSARIAVYKVCWSLVGCPDADILAAFDDAIHDGVDVITISIGANSPQDYFINSISIGAFHAMKNGILTSASASNDGPNLMTIKNFSPWFLSVAASTIDRKLMTKLQLGNDKSYEGVTVNAFVMKAGMYPIVYGGAVPNIAANFTSEKSRLCWVDTMDSNLVKGKIVLCDKFNMGQGVLAAGGVGMVIRDDDDKDFAFSFPLPATYLDADDGARVAKYINSARFPVATILKSQELENTLAPFVVSFSSRGPNPITPDILSPDVTAPGVDILAAYSPIAPISGVAEDKRRGSYNIISGTSMSCPHAAAVAAYVKSFYPSWSPAAIKSAIMTTAFPMEVTTSPAAEFAYGAGHINPVRAIHPGLIYDAGVDDYVQFLCAQGYHTTMLQRVTGDNSTYCSESTKVWDLNLPSFALSAVPLRAFSRKFTRTVTNVGSPVSTYRATVKSVEGINIRVKPNVLSFTSVGQTLSYTVSVDGVIVRRTQFSASLVWDDGEHQVRSPIVVYAL